MVLIKSLFCINDAKNTHRYASDTNGPKHDIDYQGGYVKGIFFGGSKDPYICLNVFLMYGLELWAVWLLCRSRKSWCGWLLVVCSLLCLVRLGVSLHREFEEKHRDYRQYLEHNAGNCTTKTLDRI